jgi:hypothetical protein
MWVSVALLSGYSNIDAHVNSYAFSSFQNFDTPELSGLEKIHSSLEKINEDTGATVKSADSFTLKQNDKTELTDNENEEEEASLKLAPLKKLNGLSSHYFTHSLYTKTPGYFCDQIKICLPVCKHVFNFPSQRLHVIFSVFRI